MISTLYAAAYFPMDPSWQIIYSKVIETAVAEQSGELLLILLVAHVKASAPVVKAEVINAEHPHPKAYFGPDRVQARIKGLFCDAEFGDADRNDAILVPDK